MIWGHPHLKKPPMKWLILNPHHCVGFLFLVCIPLPVLVLLPHLLCLHYTQLCHTHTHALLRTVIANSDVECIRRAKNTPNIKMKRWHTHTHTRTLYIYIWLYVCNHRSQWPYKATAIRYRPPQLRLICAQGRDYILHICRCGTVRPHSHPAESHSVVGMARETAALRSRVNERRMNMKLKWQWDDKLPNRNTRRGTQKKKGKNSKTPTPTHLARNGRTLKGQGRKSGRTTGQTPTSGGAGRMEAPDTTYKARATPSHAYLSTRRTQTWPDTLSTWNMGPMGN